MLSEDSCLSQREGKDKGAHWTPFSKLTKQMNDFSPCRKVRKGKDKGHEFYSSKVFPHGNMGDEEYVYAFNILKSWRSEINSNSFSN